jgi:parallel beta-helix repeat protein
MKRTFCVVAGVVAVAAPGLAARSSPSPSAVSCGETLTKSTTLANDLVDCPANGLVVGANGITIDLNGHTIDGTNARTPGTGGIANDGHSNVTIEDGTITDFYYSGVVLGPHNVVRKLTIRKIGAGCRQGDICAGIFLFQSGGSTITHCLVSNDVRAFQVNGIDVYNSPGTRVENNRFVRNEGVGISVYGSPKTRMVENKLQRNGQEGLVVNNGSDGALVSGNRAVGNGSAGIAVGALRRARVLSNTSTGNGDDGLFLFDLRYSLVRGNHVSRNYTGIHLYGGLGGVAQFGGKRGPAHNRLVANTSTDNKYAGIWVKGDNRKFEVEHNLLSRDKANGNGRAGGIVVQGSVSANRLQGNTANANAGRGIAAARGAIDGGGNRARDNRRRPQCVGVRCP